MKTRSLARWLMGGVLLTELLCVASFAVVATQHEMHGRRRAFDTMLRGRADTLVASTHTAGGDLVLDIRELAPPAEDIYEVDSATDAAIHTPQPPPSAFDSIRSSSTLSYFDLQWNGQSYRGLRAQAMLPANSADRRSMALPVTVLYASPTADLEDEMIQAVRFYAIRGGSILVVTGLALIWFLRWSLSPLRNLAAAARRVNAESWDFTPPDAALHTRELAPIANSIRELIGGLRRAFERQRQFTGDAAHELKTSVALLKSSLQLLTMRKRTIDQYEMGIRELRVDMQRMESLIEQMLTLARMEEASLPTAERIDLSAVVRSTALRLEPLAQVEQKAIHVEAEPAMMVAMRAGDADILVSNLIANAIHHSPVNGVVAVSVVPEANCAQLRVADNGCGIAEDALPHVFDRFYRADASRSRQSGGAGLGLAICKATVERVGGKIVIQSQVGLGTKVLVTLPLKK